MNASIFQTIFDQLQNYLSKDWKKVIFYAAYPTGSYSMKFYIDCGDGKPVDCFRLFDSMDLIRLFTNIDKVLSPERNKLNDDAKWSVMTMIVEADGNMKTNFNYSCIDDNYVKYEQEWKKAYLN